MNKNVTVGELMSLYETIGMTVEINDGQITDVNYEETN